MYLLNPTTNQLEQIEETSFFENDLRERDHIEEWIRKNPEVLEEELLIIGHEYDKFEVNERLDLLAIDKEGNLTIIEVKRDVTGGHVDFQALKYASYCSRLSPHDVLEIFADYIKKHRLEVDAIEELLSFLNLEDEEGLNKVLNNNQRIIIVGKEIDKRILSVSTWLYENNIDIKCISIKPYKLNGNIIVDTNQIIPPYKLEDYYINKKSNLAERKINIDKDVSEFLMDFVGQINSKTNYKLNYIGKRDYIVGPKFLNIPWKFIFAYKKKDNYASVFIESDKAEAQGLIKYIYENKINDLSKELNCKIELVRGSRNTELYKLVAKLDFEQDSNSDENIARFVSVFIKYKNFLERVVEERR